MNARHVVLSPDAESVDFHKASYDGRIWFKNPTPQWLTIILPAAISAACGGEDLTFSTWRRFGLINPDHFPLPPGSGWSVKIFMPLGAPFAPDLWASLTYFESGKPPVPDGSEVGIFSAKGGGLRRKLEEAFAHDRVNKLRSLDGRQRWETWVRWDWDCATIQPGAYSPPRWMQSIDPNEPTAAEKMNAWRAPTSGVEYERLRRREKALRDEKADAVRQAIASAAEAREDTPGPAEPAARAIVEAAAVSPGQEPADEHVNASPPLTLEEIKEKRKTRERLKRATRSKTAADKADKASAKAWSDKRVKALEAAGKL